MKGIMSKHLSLIVYLHYKNVQWW